MIASQGQEASPAPSASVHAAGGSTILRMLLGARLRRLREAKGFTREEAGYHIRGSQSKISRMELGRASLKERDVGDLLALYETPVSERRALLELARKSNAPSWWHRFNDVVPSWFQHYLGLEEAADALRIYDPCGIPDLLQTDDYARAYLRHKNMHASAGEIEHRLSVLLTRQRLVAREGRRLAAVVNEAALLHPLGGSRVFREQLEYLANLSDRNGTVLHVLPVEAASVPAVSFAFRFLQFDGPELPDTVYIEFLTSAHYLDREGELQAYRDAWERLVASSLSVESSRNLVLGMLSNGEHLHRGPVHSWG
ncbi:helix-turn-helix domain-containing protein [Actinomadura kijaniata]|uniref:helix-turn-helix domain-containing protein n=1 Tax=Actinomadura kijaniata TaxID=46161 RepID=UPI003F1BAFFB